MTLGEVAIGLGSLLVLQIQMPGRLLALSFIRTAIDRPGAP